MSEQSGDERSETANNRNYSRMGSVNVGYVGMRREIWGDAYHRLLTMPLAGFLLVMFTAYLLLNVLFTGLYLLDPGGIVHARRSSFVDDFFFSVQTIGTLGYGAMAPRSFYANVVVTVETFVGLLNLYVATGLLFARISRPTARIMFSSQAVVAPLDGAPTLMFRAANRRMNLVLEAEVSVTLVKDVTTLEGVTLRRFEELTPIRARSPLFFLTWQVMHRIDETSPLYGHTRESLEAVNAEIVVIIRGLDEAFVSTIHARASYLPHEIAFGARLADIFGRTADGRRTIDFGRFHDVE